MSGFKLDQECSFLVLLLTGCSAAIPTAAVCVTPCAAGSFL